MKRITLLMVLCLPVCSFAEKFKGRAPTPPMGFNSWNTFQLNISENLIKETAESMIKNGMRDAGYVYIVLDDGWQAMQRDANDNLVADPNKFPSGMKALADFLHEKGFKFGIYNCAGTKTCAGFPGGRGHEFQDARLYASWGVDYLKYDWCNHGTANAEETYRTMGNALYAAGRPIVFSICEWGTTKPWEWAKDIGHLWRTTGDITDCYDCQTVYAYGWKYILANQAGLEKFAGPDHFNDPDMLEVGNPGLSVTESRAHFSLWCMIAAPLMAGNDVRKMSDETRDILTNKEIIAIDQDPLGKQGFQYFLMKDIWVKELSNGCWAVCFFNNSAEPMKLKIDWSHMPFLKGTYQIRDLWKKADIGSTNKKFVGNLSPHDVFLVKFTPAKPVK
jgi:alpha-galactosidase